MRDIQMDIKRSDILDSLDESTKSEEEEKVACDFCHAIDVLLGTEGIVEFSDLYCHANWKNIPDEKAEAIAELVGQTLWNICI